MGLSGSRFIPAGAGNTIKCYGRADGATVHPCGRREHLLLTQSDRWLIGSSLRAQGTRRKKGTGRTGIRFIPAGAGNTCSSSVGAGICTVHPCGRREHTPRYPAFRRLRFIPAGAGNTPIIVNFHSNKPVHPCGRREHTSQQEQLVLFYGSSLRAQGTPLMFCLTMTVVRFIPAGAGNT